MECTVRDGTAHSVNLHPLRRRMCQKHYLRWKRLNPNYESRYKGRGVSQTPEDQLRLVGWTVVQRDTPYAEGPCWEWNGSTFAPVANAISGYGRFVLNGVSYKAHRVSYEAHKGVIPEGHVVRHKCDNPVCVRPGHLETGTAADNSKDMLERGRGNKHVKISEQEVVDICSAVAQGESVKTVAARYGVSASLVGRLAIGAVRRSIKRPITVLSHKTPQEQVRYIRSRPPEITNSTIAKELSIDPSTVSRIRNYKSHI